MGFSHKGFELSNTFVTLLGKFDILYTHDLLQFLL